MESAGDDVQRRRVDQPRCHLAAADEPRDTLDRIGELVAKRRRQNVDWMWATIDDRLLSRFRASEAVRAQAGAIEDAVRAGAMSPTAAAHELLDLA
jgi:LAO/AO transport system kinase